MNEETVGKSESASGHRPQCPRCGYDQSGAIAAWGRIESACCPLSGVCTECGLEFAWRDVLNPEYSRQLRLFEHARRRMLGSFLLTWWKAARPWSFWRWVKMEHQVHPWRFCAMAVLGLLLTHAVMVLSLSLVGLVGDVVDSVKPAWGYHWLSIGSAAEMAIYPFGSSTYYSPGLFDRFARITALQLIAVLTCITVPLTFVLIPFTLRRAKVRRRHLARIWAYSLVWLPVSLGAAGAVMILDLAACSILGLFGAIKPWRVRLIPGSLDGWITLVVTLTWLFAWWSFAADRYLRIPHSGTVAGLLTLFTVLLSTLLVLLFGGHWLFMSM